MDDLRRTGKPGISRHHGLYLQLAQRIAADEFAAGTRFPTEAELGAHYGVSRVTVRRALEALKAEGLLSSVQGQGTFVTRRPSPGGTALELRDALDELRAVAGTTRVDVLAFDTRVPPPGIAEKLGLASGDEAQFAVRLRSRDRRPVLHVTSWIPAMIGTSWTKADMGRASLVELLGRAGREVGRIEQIISARLSTPDLAHILRVDPGAALLRVQLLYRDTQGRPIAHLEALGSADYQLSHVVTD